MSKIVSSKGIEDTLPAPNELIPAKHLTVHWGDFELLELTE